MSVHPDPRTMDALPGNGAGAGFSMKAHAAAMRSTPKQDYSAAWEQTQSPAAGAGTSPEAGTGPAATPSSPSAPTAAPAADADGEKKYADAAREFIEVYDTGQAFGFGVLSKTRDPKRFQLDPWSKERATHHLARGLKAMGRSEMHWGLGLAIALTPPAVANYFTARELRKAAEAKATLPPNANRTTAATPGKATPDPAPPATQVADGIQAQRPATGARERTAVPGQMVVETEHARNAKEKPRKGPPCAVCGKVTKHKRSKYCSQRCAGIGTTRVNAERRTATPPNTQSNG